MTPLRAAMLVIGFGLGGLAGWACGLGGCGLAKCNGGFQLELKVDESNTDPITLEIEVENGRATYKCDLGTSRCSRESSLDGDRDFDFIVTVVGATVPFNGLPCAATACIHLKIAGESDDDGDPGTYGPESVVVSIIDENGEQWSQDYAPDYDRTDHYGGPDCGYCDSLDSHDEHVTID